MKLITVIVPNNTKTPEIDEDGNIIDQGTIPTDFLALLKHISSIGSIVRRNKKMLNIITTDNFICHEEYDAEDNLLPITIMPDGWELVSAHRINNGGRDKVRYEPQPPVIIPANKISDAVSLRHKRYHRYYINPLFNNDDLMIGCEIRGRIGEMLKIVVPSTEPFDPILDENGDPTGAVIINDKVYPEMIIDDNFSLDGGHYTEYWETPIKIVEDIGEVYPEDLEDDGTYIHTPKNIIIEEEGLEELISMSPAMRVKYVQHMPDINAGRDNAGTRPPQAKEIQSFGFKSRF